jgi:uncharacterized protein
MSAGNWKELFSATIEGNLNLVKYHVKNGTNVDYQHPEIMMTILVAAIKEGHTKIAIYLLQTRPNPLMQNELIKNTAKKFL